MNSKPTIRVTLQYDADTDTWDLIAHGNPDKSLSKATLSDILTKVSENATSRADAVKAAKLARGALNSPPGRGSSQGVHPTHP